MRFHDAHNHLQDPRFPDVPALVASAQAAGVVRMVVNGTCEADWPCVTKLARDYPALVQPSYGLHPWSVPDAAPGWADHLREHVKADPRAVIGETGLDRWKADLPWEGQKEAFRIHLELAAVLNRPVSIHCLRAWGPLVDILKSMPLPACGFLMHSYGGSLEVAQTLLELGAYFSFPGAFAREKKIRQRDVFRKLPRDRILIETDAPDQLLPRFLMTHPLTDPDGHDINHPANLPAIYAFMAEAFGCAEEGLVETVEANFTRLFGSAH